MSKVYGMRGSGHGTPECHSNGSQLGATPRIGTAGDSNVLKLTRSSSTPKGRAHARAQLGIPTMALAWAKSASMQPDKRARTKSERHATWQQGKV
jgi:hypothetical protein